MTIKFNNKTARRTRAMAGSTVWLSSSSELEIGLIFYGRNGSPIGFFTEASLTTEEES